MKAKTSLATALLGLSVAGPAGAALILSDNFTDTTPGDTYQQVNENLSTRQAGSQATQIWSGAGNYQVGNNYPNFGQPTGDFLLIADQAGNARLDSLFLNSSLVPSNEMLVIRFDTDTHIEYGDPSNWLSFMISPSAGDGTWHPVVGSGDFGMLIRGNGQIQAFNNGAVVGGINNFSLASAGINTITLTFSGLDGTGSPFAGNGTRVNISDGTNSWNANLDTGLTTETISFGTFGNGTRGFVDNLSISTVPEPAVSLLGGLGLLALLRRRRP
ncbi:MAG: hypothetical protein EAZ65_02715 [Verrucomicrobia bacterium]|nr:MAG: hypothetical protein EAZ84_13500 [Verrucomicrobiota bacterium]TAE88835.1 MAG: hypothetical protein EAZ82_02010 [Verrucomicrobiota bacterium]TAF27252.1 MAG: hypothetical protein EAZ71_01975 [Verrucomicrobiota bacterium]TAF42457.1 MAG: hypothetical protein EAZ65_02715 [Verrucomicrobiota bacterium]